jgi:hypothetical protein
VRPKAQKKVRRAFTQYIREFAAIEHAANDQIATIPPAPDDLSLIQVWIRARNELVDLEVQLFGNTPHFKMPKGAQRFFSLFFQLAAKEQEVSDLVEGFGFQHCNTPPAEIQFIGNTFR